MIVIRHKDPDFAQQIKRLQQASSLFDPEIEQRTAAIIEQVKKRGDAALLELTARFDGATLAIEGLQVSKTERFNASLSADAPLREALEAAHENIAAFARKSRRRNWSRRNAQGGRVGEKFDPLQRVGIYIPGGTAPLVSTALMTVTLAKVAGCPRIVVCTPPQKDGSVNPALLLALNMAGATEIYKAGGSQAIAAMAFGTQTIEKVQKIFGPGNAYVVAAKRLVFGHVGIDLLPGPSEVLVLADDSANPRFVAADLLAQAEHGSTLERVWLVTPSAKLAGQVAKEIERQLPKLTREELIRAALRKGGAIVQTRDMDQAIALINELAPEHCEVMTARPAKVSERILTAGALFLGPDSPTVLGDYLAGPSHVLPTGGAGIFQSGLTVDQFQRRTSVVEFGSAALKRTLPFVEKFAAMEGLDAHGRSASIRVKLAKGRKPKAA